eukprot:TRINITY_DN53408_c0_g1_i4.p2 TRINITY_DN53408_c0_g1~~TRINITY_DN53408_c0_g1_i4.p2  ORF type:complete len:166 (-),score=14.50 TRINITY_DN53408_c0_g1_i4:138-635(-)
MEPLHYFPMTEQFILLLVMVFWLWGAARRPYGARGVQQLGLRTDALEALLLFLCGVVCSFYFADSFSDSLITRSRGAVHVDSMMSDAPAVMQPAIRAEKATAAIAGEEAHTRFGVHGKNEVAKWIGRRMNEVHGPGWTCMVFRGTGAGSGLAISDMSVKLSLIHI